MPQPIDRLSEVLKDFNAMIERYPDDIRARMKDARAACYKPVRGRILEDGTVVDRVSVDPSPLVMASPPELYPVARAVAQRLVQEASFRGPDWALEGLHLALEQFCQFGPEAKPAPAPVAAAS